ncbi:MAG: ribonuclease P protein component [Flavobacteriales bacterium]
MSVLTQTISYKPGETLPKQERLNRKKLIEEVYDNGASVKSPAMVAVFMPMELSEPVPVQVMFAVSKRNYKRAHDRNRVKRILRESYRKQKSILYNSLIEQQKQLALIIIFTGRQLPNYQYVHGKMNDLLKKTIEQLGNTTEEGK